MATVAEDDMAEGSMAMVMGDDAVESYGSFLTLNSIESKQSGDMFSPEDVNWSDSCLIKDAELSETWTSLMDALTEAFSSHPDTLASSTTAEIDALSPGIDFKISSESLEKPVRTVYDIVPNLTDEELEKNSDKHLIDETSDFLWSSDKNRNGFIPTYKDVSEADNFDADFDSSFPAFVMEPTTEDIFKVWDLDIPTEEDEISKQLKNLSVDASKSAPSDFDDFGVAKESTEESVDDLVTGILNLSLDDLISGISELSLSEKSG